MPRSHQIRSFSLPDRYVDFLDKRAGKLAIGRSEMLRRVLDDLMDTEKAERAARRKTRTRR